MKNAKLQIVGTDTFWISRDPRGNAHEDVHSLLTLRAYKYPYSFCENNPVSRVDSNGDSWHDIWEWIKEKLEALWEAIKAACGCGAGELAGAAEAAKGMTEAYTNAPCKNRFLLDPDNAEVPPVAGY